MKKILWILTAVGIGLVAAAVLLGSEATAGPAAMMKGQEETGRVAGHLIR